MTRAKQKNSGKVLVKVLLALATLLVIAGLLEALNITHFLDSKKTTNNSASPTETVNYNPPTAEEQQETEQHKEDIAKDPSQSEPTGGDKSVKPIITYADQYGSNVEVGSYVSGVIEDGGTCKATFSRGNNHVTKTVNGVGDVSTTLCPTIKVPVSEFNSSGQWTLVITYTSTSSTGTSESQNINVQK